jgi:hypothetical protein
LKTKIFSSTLKKRSSLVINSLDGLLELELSPGTFHAYYLKNDISNTTPDQNQNKETDRQINKQTNKQTNRYNERTFKPRLLKG